ncbi:MAG: efflux transporter outer membrane subunit [Muribaculaceae bacterium]
MKQYIGLLLLTLTISSGCNTYREYERPKLDIESLNTDSISSGVVINPADSLTWREFFRDKNLQSLIDTGLVNNSDIRIATLKVVEAEASLKAARLAYLPQISLTPQGNISTVNGSIAKTYNLALSAQWELDIVGRLTAEKRGAYATAQMYYDAKQAVKTQLIATIANSYYTLLLLDKQLRISVGTLETWKETVRTLKAKKAVGEANEAAVTQAMANTIEIESNIVKLTQQINEQENALNVLLGVTSRQIKRGSLDGQELRELPETGISLSYLSFRPDVRRAEHALQTAFYATNVARAAFYPQVNLSGSLGWTNSDGGSIVNPGKWLTSALGSIVQPLFNRGKNRANLTIAKARQEEAFIEYRQQLLKAGAEVNDAIDGCKKADERLGRARERKELLKRTVICTKLLMEHSEETSYLEVLTAQQSLFQAELDVAQEEYNKIYYCPLNFFAGR